MFHWVFNKCLKMRARAHWIVGFTGMWFALTLSVRAASPQNAITKLFKHQKKQDTKSKKTTAKNKKVLESLSIAALGNLKITTYSKEPEEVWRTPAAIDVISQEDIRRSGALTVPDVLRLAPGVEVAQMDSDHWAVAIRGLNSQFSRYMLVLIDGRSVYSPLQGGVYWEFEMPPIADIERIEIIRGPGGTIWGSNAVNGVINIITKSAGATRGSMLAAHGGSLDRAGGEYRYGAVVGKKFSYRVYGAAFDRGPEYHPDGDTFDVWDTGKAGFRADWQPHALESATFEGDFFKANDGIRTAFASLAPPAQVTVDGIEDVSGGDLTAQWKRQFKNGSDIQVRAYFERSNILTPQLGELRDIFDVDFVNHLPLPYRQDLIWGLGADVSPRTIVQTEPTVNLVPNRATDQTYSAFAQDQIELLPNHLWLTGGAKILHENYTGIELEPSARLLWSPGPRKTLWAAVARAIRTPSDIDEGLDLTGFDTANPFPIFVKIVGNDQFFPEREIGYSAGYRTLVGSKAYLDISAFDNDYNYLQSYGALPPYFTIPPLELFVPVDFVNGVEGDTKGFEIAPDWKPAHWWDLKGGYSFLHLDMRSRPGFPLSRSMASTDNGSSPGSEIVIESRFNLPRGFEIDPTYRYVSSLPALSIPAYGTADLHLGWRASSHLELSISGQNLLQPRHLEFNDTVGLPVGIRRSVHGGITLHW